ncbi:hypothetical protein OC842_007636 [Tilletia horrida]|uniref:F-box domain-containing protein n=1 Tax=Tilletia horrida TaxID=155126 RepID=A0AAN6JGQ3_9BASI|nr:hypothetical protein OC842_007636 [Tilletia horrida]
MAHTVPASLLTLPAELLHAILTLPALDYRDLAILRGTCRTLRTILAGPRYDYALFRLQPDEKLAQKSIASLDEAQAEDKDLFFDALNGQPCYLLRASSCPIELHPTLHKLLWHPVYERPRSEPGGTNASTLPYMLQGVRCMSSLDRPTWLGESASRPALSEVRVSASPQGHTTNRTSDFFMHIPATDGGQAVTVEQVINASIINLEALMPAKRQQWPHYGIYTSRAWWIIPEQDCDVSELIIDFTFSGLTEKDFNAARPRATRAYFDG